MSLFYLYNPKFFLDPGDAISGGALGAHRKKKIETIEIQKEEAPALPEVVEITTPVVEVLVDNREYEQNLLKFQNYSRKLQELQNELLALAAENELRNQLIAEQERIQRIRIEVAKQILKIEEEEAAALMLLID